MPTLFSYVVQHDYGLSPNPSGGYCTLAFCKYRRPDGRPNVVELAQVGDWVAGTGGKSELSAGHGRLIYAMRVTEKLTLREYFRDGRFSVRGGNVGEWANEGDMFALVSDHFYYFGANAPRLRHGIEKRGPGFRRHFRDELVQKFVGWVEGRWTVGIHGPPCAPHPDADWVGYEGFESPDGRIECRSPRAARRNNCRRTPPKANSCGRRTLPTRSPGHTTHV